MYIKLYANENLKKEEIICPFIPSALNSNHCLDTSNAICSTMENFVQYLYSVLTEKENLKDIRNVFEKL